MSVRINKTGRNDALARIDHLVIIVDQLLDIATSVSSFGTIRQRQVTGEPLEQGWVIHSKTGESILAAVMIGFCRERGFGEAIGHYIHHHGDRHRHSLPVPHDDRHQRTQ